MDEHVRSTVGSSIKSMKYHLCICFFVVTLKMSHILVRCFAFRPPVQSSVLRLLQGLIVVAADISTMEELRWFLFRKKQAKSDRLSPSHAALLQAILRAHFNLMVWNKDYVPNPVLLSLSDYGWAMEKHERVPVMTHLGPAPEAIIQLVKCKCAKKRCPTKRCQGRKAGLLCKGLCSCSDDGDCENQQDGLFQNDEEEDDF